MKNRKSWVIDNYFPSPFLLLLKTRFHILFLKIELIWCPNLPFEEFDKVSASIENKSPDPSLSEISLINPAEVVSAAITKLPFRVLP